MSQKGVKEAFVANLNGTTLLEISLGLPLAPSCLLARGLLLILYFLHRGEPLRSRSGHFLLDFAVLVVPPILSCTILAPFLPLVILSLWAFCAGLLLAVYRRRGGGVLRGPLKHALRHFGETSLAPEYIPSITVFRVYVNVLTSIAILAVDFPQYPRRYAKTESFGTGVMDFGVGSFVFGNAVVCPEVRQKPGAVPCTFYLAKQVLAVWPLLLLGLGRLMSLKVVGYQEHVSEYGLHWNFFFTLAAVRMAASLLLGVFSARRAWIVAMVLAVAYECLLAVTPLKSFILSGSDGQGSRAGFLSANREGLFSVIGYLAIYMASVQVGLYLRQKRTTVGEWMGVARTFLLAAFLLLAGLHVTQTHVERVSRRMANLAFCLWVEAHCLLLFSTFLAADLALVFAKLLVEGAPVPGSWELAEPSAATRKKRDEEPQARKAAPQGVCVIGAVNRNQLLYFLLANVLTGLANMLVDTLHSSTPSALLVLHLYMFANCLVMYVLQAKNIVLKWW
ncbi:phosphatidylinositol-glycan biosynthesis class W protein-like [Hemicordylus capensis]|uniref:phosphatidylinositol-glycan biosynthesis class W protein-like n=1 Tax=Hemicordylus capensis TaxID=884348 RepID=UPI00230422A6|nr:phosphatidylinositol-glycan biosynthesis class W protein-like [Hemicordylus capensis]XP_053131449.1 phosphatidylinositol-glycan biosynthesis class W protein-like [Hemicordylus capensis]XP_053131450.1 phosphatidylinositol-glycan biosynthesis class W protein-like [Hemicordylus capensis]XP_053131451.1 phosphatidylinositol-glycan biosynthesis class W protein-like [Hemicordylus capensis]XP_053131452.1 phosphatidylinositol-glycan biosynthesis class W protein-like [Hemicordylus capensis]